MGLLKSLGVIVFNIIYYYLIWLAYYYISMLVLLPNHWYITIPAVIIGIPLLLAISVPVESVGGVALLFLTAGSTLAKVVSAICLVIPIYLGYESVVTSWHYNIEYEWHDYLIALYVSVFAIKEYGLNIWNTIVGLFIPPMPEDS